MSPLKILIVDDDPGIRELIQLYLQEQGLVVESVEDAVEMDAWLAHNQADIMVLDLMLPGEDGLSIARRLRAESSMGILMLSARAEEIDRIIGLEVGADDYLAKPFNPRELLARIRALSRRQSQIQKHEQNRIEKSRIEKSKDTAENNRYLFGSYCIDFSAHTLVKDDQPVVLTHSEYELLTLLVKHPNHVLSRDTLINKLQGYDRSPYDRSIDVCISRLRGKMGEKGGLHSYIETIRGVGYRFNAPDNSCDQM